MDHDRELLLGLLALRAGKLSADQLLQLAVSDHDPQPFAEHLVAAGYLRPEDCAWLTAMVNEAVASHDDDPAAALAAYTAEEARAEARSPRSPVLAADDGHGDAEAAAVVEEIPGRYRDAREHGQGGIGRVWTVRDEYLGREIALKELLLTPQVPSSSTEGEQTAQLTARFLREARITGQLEHPSIVPVYEVGHRLHGGLYYTMKLVRGQTLSRVLKDTRSLPDRLALLPHFVDLCQAIAYAHSRGVIHRDIKPSNVMVGEFGETVVIDWGLAKARGQEDIHARKLQRASRKLRLRAEEESAKTAYGEAIGTPVYMSPEQACGELDRVDERSDIYSLGVMLYELLAGKAPFAGGTTSALVMKVAGRDPTPIVSVEAAAPVELVAICERAMSHEPEHRYQTAAELADEVQGFLSGGLVHAYQYRFTDHLRRFIARHRVAVGTALASVLVLFLGLSAATFWSTRERRRAELEATTAKQVSQFLVDLFEVSEPGETRGNTITAREILDRGAAKIHRELQGQPRTQARLMTTIGSVYRQLGLYEEADRLLLDALAIQERLLGPYHPEVAESLFERASLLDDQGEYERAKDLLLHSQSIYEKQYGQQSVKVALCKRMHAMLNQRQGRFEEAETLHRESIEILKKRLGPDNISVALGLRAYGSLLMEVGRFSEAEQQIQQALVTLESAQERDHPDIATCLSHLATVKSYQGKFVEAEPLFRRSLEIYEQCYGPHHQTVATALNNLAVNLWYQERFDEIEPLYRRALAIWKHALGANHPRVATGLANLAELYWKQGRYDEAEPLYRRALSIYETSFGEQHPEVAQALYGLANLYRDQGRYDKAEPLYQRSLAIREQILSPGHPQLRETIIEYAKLLRAMGNEAGAVKLEQRLQPDQAKG